MTETEKQIYLLPEGEGISFKDIWAKLMQAFSFLKSKWVILLVMGAVGGVTGYLRARATKPEYTASLTYVMEAPSSSGGGILGTLAGQFGIGSGSAQSNGGIFSNLTDLFKSRTVMERVLLKPVTIKNKQTTLADQYIAIRELKIKKWNKNRVVAPDISFPPGTDPLKLSLVQSATLSTLVAMIGNENLSNKPKGKGSTYTEVSVVSPDEDFSKIFLESLIKEVTDFYTQTKIKKAKQNVAILQRQYDSVRAEMNQSMGDVAQNENSTFNLNPALPIKKLPGTKRQVDVQTNVGMLAQIVQNLEFSKMNLLQETPLIQIVDAPRLPLPARMPSRVKGGILFGVVFIVLASIVIVAFNWTRIYGRKRNASLT